MSTIEMVSTISARLIMALSMHAENMQRQFLGQSPAYSEEQFLVIINLISSLLKKWKERKKFGVFKEWWKYYLGMGLGVLLGIWLGFILWSPK